MYEILKILIFINRIPAINHMTMPDNSNIFNQDPNNSPINNNNSNKIKNKRPSHLILKLREFVHISQ